MNTNLQDKERHKELAIIVSFIIVAFIIGWLLFHILFWLAKLAAYGKI